MRATKHKTASTPSLQAVSHSRSRTPILTTLATLLLMRLALAITHSLPSSSYYMSLNLFLTALLTSTYFSTLRVHDQPSTAQTSSARQTLYRW
ncbi:hypothetical protein LTR16_009702, partial [Cryomyces antarcticus]